MHKKGLLGKSWMNEEERKDEMKKIEENKDALRKSWNMDKQKRRASIDYRISKLIGLKDIVNETVVKNNIEKDKVYLFLIISILNHCIVCRWEANH